MASEGAYVFDPTSSATGSVVPAELQVNGDHPPSERHLETGPITNGITNGTGSDSGRVGTKIDYSAIVIGAGFGGLRMLHELRQRGHTVRVLEAASDVGGTWFWNRYPGARTDSECPDYMLNFSKELRDEWDWPERYSTQEQVYKYLSHVADRFNMRPDIQLNTPVAAAHFNEGENTWTVTTKQGEKFVCTYLITAVGPLSVARKSPFPGQDSFQGECYETSNWPREQEVDFVGKRVAVIGTGATGVQLIPVVAHNADMVTVFQQTPNYVLPARNYPMTKERMREIKRDYAKSWKKSREQAWGAANTWGGGNMSDVTDDAERQRILEGGWENGGFRFVFETFNDMFSSAETNEYVCKFIRKKIRATLKDPKMADLMCPDYPLLAKRPPLGHFFYEAFNRPNVKLVSVRDDPIKEITPKGLRTGTTDYEFDIIILAIGFDAVTGPLNRIDIRGKNGLRLSDKWSDRLDTLFGISVEGFPNMFMISGPHAPFANLPVIIDNTSDWIGQAISHLDSNGRERMEAKHEAANEWREKVMETFNRTILPDSASKAHSWYVGANVPGKRSEVLFYFGGLPAYFKLCQAEVDSGFPGFTSSVKCH